MGSPSFFSRLLFRCGSAFEVVLRGGGPARALAWRMVDRKLRWEVLDWDRPFPFEILDKVGQKRYAAERGVRVAETVARFDRADLLAAADALPEVVARLAAASTRFVLKPSRGYQNVLTYAVRDGVDLVRDHRPFDAREAVAAILDQGRQDKTRASTFFESFVVEELLEDEDPWPALPTDYKCWCFGPCVEHVTFVTRRTRLSDDAYLVDVADADATYAPASTWCAPGDPARGLVRHVPLPPKPRCWDALVHAASRLGADLGCFVRIDFYATPKGPVFGEFQLLLDLDDWNENADAAVHAHWRGPNGGSP